jgi:hypothetical protein
MLMVLTPREDLGKKEVGSWGRPGPTKKLTDVSLVSQDSKEPQQEAHV